MALSASSEDEVYTYDPYDNKHQFVTVVSHNTVYICPGYPGCGYGGTHHVVILEDPCDGI
ncbi:hypothetical protein JZ751_025418 [Albula glossodonta]|uniref:Uncharacterized protein n=1 Tax=Albula glossodonta TaxID=121402 RepID=A0A8T2MQS3_9TELE|nr:hypothetical protein JZ751_025418 [Albula glossodonta]